MKQILITVFFVLIISFGVIGFVQTAADSDDTVEKESSATVNKGGAPDQMLPFYNCSI